MDRAPGLSVRLKLTLSYAGFLMLAGALLLGAVWLFLLRYVPRGEIVLVHGTHVLVSPGRGALLRDFAPSGGHRAGVSAGVRSPGRVASRRPDARPSGSHHRRHTHGCEPGRCLTESGYRAASDEFRELADAFDAMLERLEAHVAEQQRFAANASHELRTPLAITQTLLEVARDDPDRGNGELVDRLLFVNTRAIDLTEALLVLSRADQRSFTPEPVDLSLVAEEATETLLPLAEKRGVTIETSGDAAPTIGSAALLLQLTTNLVHNAIVHNLPVTRHCVGHDERPPRRRGAHCREYGREAQPTAGLHARRAVSAWHRTHTHRPRRRRPRPGHRQEHHPGTRRESHPHTPSGRRALRHGAATPSLRARCQMTNAGLPASQILGHSDGRSLETGSAAARGDRKRQYLRHSGRSQAPQSFPRASRPRNTDQSHGTRL